MHQFHKFILARNSACFGHRNCPKHVEFRARINLWNWCIWLVLLQRNSLRRTVTCHDARSHVTTHGHMSRHDARSHVTMHGHMSRCTVTCHDARSHERKLFQHLFHVPSVHCTISPYTPSPIVAEIETRLPNLCKFSARPSLLGPPVPHCTVVTSTAQTAIFTSAARTHAQFFGLFLVERKQTHLFGF